MLFADQIDLAIDKEVGDPAPSEGDTLVYTLTVHNHGPADASGIMAHDPLPAGVTYVHFVSDIGPDDFTGPYSYRLDYGDGTTPVSGTSSGDPLALEHTYAITGNWAVQIEVWNCQMTEHVVDTVQVLVIESAYDIYLPIVIRNG